MQGPAVAILKNENMLCDVVLCVRKSDRHPDPLRRSIDDGLLHI